MTDKTSLGDRMKSHELPTRQVLPRRTYAIIRVDMRAAHTYLRGAERPFDYGFHTAMDHMVEMMCERMDCVQFAYTQSDEASFLLTDFTTVETQPWFGGVVAKQISISAALATAAFISQEFTQQRGGLPLFDSRVFTIPDPVEVANYFLWRQRDAIRNSISMAAQSVFSHRELMCKNTDMMQEMLWTQHRINWSHYPPGAKQGRVITRMGTGWSASPAPAFQANPETFLANIIPPLPSLI